MPKALRCIHGAHLHVFRGWLADPESLAILTSILRSAGVGVVPIENDNQRLNAIKRKLSTTNRPKFLDVSEDAVYVRRADQEKGPWRLEQANVKRCDQKRGSRTRPRGRPKRKKKPPPPKQNWRTKRRVRKTGSEKVVRRGGAWKRFMSEQKGEYNRQLGVSYPCFLRQLGSKYRNLPPAEKARLEAAGRADTTLSRQGVNPYGRPMKAAQPSQAKSDVGKAKSVHCRSERLRINGWLSADDFKTMECPAKRFSARHSMHALSSHTLMQGTRCGEKLSHQCWMCCPMLLLRCRGQRGQR